MFVAMCCLCFSLIAGNDRSLLLQNDKLSRQDQNVLSKSVVIIDFIAQVSDDQELGEQVAFFLATQNQIQKFVHISTMMDRSLKDFKKICKR